MASERPKSVPIAVQNLKRIWKQKQDELHITQSQAAQRLGWTQGAFSQYLNNITELNAQAVIKLANFLDVSPLDIDPDIAPELPYLMSVPVVADTSGNKLNEIRYVPGVAEAFVTVRVTKPIEGILKAPPGSHVVCFASDRYERGVRQNAKKAIYLIMRKKADTMEAILEDDLPPKTELKHCWKVFSVTVY